MTDTTTPTIRTRSTPQPPEGASLLPLPQFTLAQEIAREACERGLVAGFFGDAGTGKTRAIEHFVETSGVGHGWITASPSPGRKEIFEEILNEFTGTIPAGSARQLRRDCLELLAEERRVLVIDEAQHLSYLWLQQARTLHDAGRGTWALFLVGGMGCARRIQSSRELWSRLGLQVEFTPLAGTTVINALNALHPVFANTTDAVLAAIDERAFHGNLRDWTMFLTLALPLLPKTNTPDRLSEKVVRAVFAKMGIK